MEHVLYILGKTPDFNDLVNRLMIVRPSQQGPCFRLFATENGSNNNNNSSLGTTSAFILNMAQITSLFTCPMICPVRGLSK